MILRHLCFSLSLIAAMALPTTPTIVNRPLPTTELRDSSVNFIVIHYDSTESINTTIRFLKQTGRSYHYLIGKTGIIYKLLDPKWVGGHAGLSRWAGYDALNFHSIGICLNNNGHQPYTSAQYNSLGWLIWTLDQRYHNIHNIDIVGHSDIAYPRGRKRDPGPFFSRDSLYRYIHS